MLKLNLGAGFHILHAYLGVGVRACIYAPLSIQKDIIGTHAPPDRDGGRGNTDMHKTCFGRLAAN